MTPWRAHKSDNSITKKVNLMSALERARRLAPEATELDAETRLVEDDKYNQSAWAILYGALVDGFGVSPESFQMTYPYQAWNWPTQSLGYIGPDQYDTLSVIPGWSAIGKYTSTGVRFNDQYIAFLNVILPDTSDPDLRKRIDVLADQLNETINQYDRALQQAKQAYSDDDSPDKPTSFTKWLGTLDGRSWQTKIDALDKAMSQAQANYQAAVNESRTPNLTEAMEAYGDEDFWAQLNDPNLKAMPKVPSWSTSISASKWRDKAANGDVPGGAVSISNSDSAYDFSKTWAKGSASVGSWFWQVRVDGQWTRIETFENDDNLSASVQFEGIEEIAVQPSGWYLGVSALAKGPYKRGYSEHGEGDTQAVFGESGFLPMLKTGMYVVYRPSFMITVNQSTFSSIQETFNAATGIRIGPFTFTAEGGSSKAGWTASESGLSFSGKTDSTEPFILGYTLRVMP